VDVFAADIPPVQRPQVSQETPGPSEARKPLAIEPLTHAKLVGEARRRVRSRLYGRDQLATIASGFGFLAAAAFLMTALPLEPMPPVAVLLLLVACHAATSRIEFELGSGFFVPTQLVLVPMLFLAPPALLPLLVALGNIISGLPDLLAGRLHVERIFVRLSYSWHAIGPAIVFGVFTPGPPAWSDWPVYALALAAQFAFDFASSVGREWFGVGVAPRILVPILARTYLVDLLLAPIGFLGALAATGTELGFLPVLSLAAFLALLASDRRERMGETVQLSDAFETASSAARKDRLTGLANRLAWEEHVEALGRVVAKDPQPVSVVIVDVDGLKVANDTRGHSFGDALIQTAASVVSTSLGDRGLVARLGGDELGAVLPGVDAAGCEELLERLEEAIRRHPGMEDTPLSVSVGAASTPPERTLIDAVDRADFRMYQRKRRAPLARGHH
jgi:diguanylate cyclase (GGDEF)-like protein